MGELHGARYVISGTMLERCARHPLPPEVATAALTAVIVHNRLGDTPAVVCEAEEMFLQCQNHGWAQPKQVYIVVRTED